MSVTIVTDPTIEDMAERADELFDQLNRIPQTPATTHMRAGMQAELDELCDQIAAERRRQRRIQAEIDAAADRLIEQAKTTPVAKVSNYRHQVDTADEGRAFLRAGVDSKACTWMAIVEITWPEDGRTQLEVVDAAGGRGVARYCRKFGMKWEIVDEYPRCTARVRA